MARRRRFKAAYLLGSLLLLAASLHPPTAYSAPGDPPSGSPAGAVYQLPLEQGRSDAAPKGNGGTGAEAGGGSGDNGGSSGSSGSGNTGGGGETGESGSLYRSENNFGSSSQVPGTAGAATNGGGSGNVAGTAGAGGHGAGGAGAGSAAIASGTIAAETADTGNTSIPASIVLLGAIALLAVAVGVLSRRYARGRTRS